MSLESSPQRGTPDLSRRSYLKLTATGIGAALAAACGPFSPSEPSTPTAPAKAEAPSWDQGSSAEAGQTMVPCTTDKFAWFVELSEENNSVKIVEPDTQQESTIRVDNKNVIVNGNRYTLEQGPTMVALNSSSGLCFFLYVVEGQEKVVIWGTSDVPAPPDATIVAE